MEMDSYRITAIAGIALFRAGRGRMQQRVGHQSDRAVLLSPQFDGYDSNYRF